MQLNRMRNIYFVELARQVAGCKGQKLHLFMYAWILKYLEYLKCGNGLDARGTGNGYSEIEFIPTWER